MELFHLHGFPKPAFGGPVRGPLKRTGAEEGVRAFTKLDFDRDGAKLVLRDRELANE